MNVKIPKNIVSVDESKFEDQLNSRGDVILRTARKQHSSYEDPVNYGNPGR